MELNRLYASFVARNPYFEANGGKVSVVAHSLGESVTQVFYHIGSDGCCSTCVV